MVLEGRREVGERSTGKSGGSGNYDQDVLYEKINK